MPFRSDSEIREHFTEVVRRFDEHINRARQALDAHGILIENRSNRSGFEKSGFPYFVWEHWFEHRAPHGPEIAQSLSIITYLEPLEAGTAPEIKVRSIAEIFQIGQASRFKRDSKEKFGLNEFLSRDLSQTVLDSIHRAQKQLAPVS